MLHLEELECRVTPTHLIGFAAGLAHVSHLMPDNVYTAQLAGVGVVSLPHSGINHNVPLVVSVEAALVGANNGVDHTTGKMLLDDHHGDRAFLYVWGDTQAPGSLLPERLHYSSAASGAGETGVFTGQILQGDLDLVFSGMVLPERFWMNFV